MQSISAEGAIHMRAESRFQRYFGMQHEILGHCPSLMFEGRHWRETETAGKPPFLAITARSSSSRRRRGHRPHKIPHGNRPASIRLRASRV